MPAIEREKGMHHVWAVGDFRLGLLHVSEDDFNFKEKEVKGSGSILGFGEKKFSLWRYVVTPEYVIVKAGKVTIKAKVHEAGLGTKFIRTPYLGYLVVDKLRLRAPFLGEEKIIKEVISTKSISF